MGEDWMANPDNLPIVVLAMCVVAVVTYYVLNRAWQEDCGYPDCDQRHNPYHSHDISRRP